MKYKVLIITTAIAFASSVIVAQTDESKSENKADTTSIKIGSTKILIIDGAEKDSVQLAKEHKIREKDFNAWSGIDLGVNGLMTADNSLSLPKELNYLELDYAKSMVWNLNLIGVDWEWLDPDKEDDNYKPVGLGIVSGIGLSFRSYSFENNTSLVNLNDSTFGYIDSTVNYNKNKLRTTYLRVPMMVQFYSKRRKGNEVKTAFHFAAGVIGGVRIGNLYKTKYKVDGDEVKDKVRDDFNLTPLTLDAEVRIGYGHMSMFASYGLTPLFEKNKAPELYPITVGISLTRLI